MTSFYFNNRSNGIFADGYRDRDGAPVGDTFVSRLRAKIVGTAGRNWSKAENAALAANYSSAEMDAIMSEPDYPHVRVEFDRNFYGGNYAGLGEHVFVPEALIDVMEGDVAAAFAKFTRIDAVHMVGYTGDERFDADGEPLGELEFAAERCA